MENTYPSVPQSYDDSPVVYSQPEYNPSYPAVPQNHQTELPPQPTSYHQKYNQTYVPQQGENPSEQEPAQSSSRRGCCASFTCTKCCVITSIICTVMFFVLTPRFLPWFMPCTMITGVMLAFQYLNARFSEDVSAQKYYKHLSCYTIIIGHLFLLNVGVGLFPLVVIPAGLWGIALGIHSMKYHNKYNHCFGKHLLVYICLMSIFFFCTVYSCSISVRIYHDGENHHRDTDEKPIPAKRMLNRFEMQAMNTIARRVTMEDVVEEQKGGKHKHRPEKPEDKPETPEEPEPVDNDTENKDDHDKHNDHHHNKDDKKHKRESHFDVPLSFILPPCWFNGAGWSLILGSIWGVIILIHYRKHKRSSSMEQQYVEDESQDLESQIDDNQSINQ